MLRFNDIVFGPIHSRRLGSSLGINLLPPKGKLCNFDCVYCECGWNRDGRLDCSFPAFEAVASSLENAFPALAQNGTHIDSITFSGNGEPTLHPDFPKTVDLVLSLRDKYFPGAAVSVLSNATRLDIPEIFEALKKVDNPILKLDAPTDALAAAINHPAEGCSIARTVENLKKFNGRFILQTMFLKGNRVDYELHPDELEAWMKTVREVHPARIMAYSLDRPSPQQGLCAMPAETMKKLLAPLMDEGFEIIVNQ